MLQRKIRTIIIICKKYQRLLVFYIMGGIHRVRRAERPFFSGSGFYIEVRQSFSGDSVLRCASLVRLHRTSSLAERFWPESARPFFSTDPLYRPGCMLRRWFGYKYLFETKTSPSFMMMRDFGQEFCFQAACYNRKVFCFQ